MQTTDEILQITAATKGEYVNVYGLGADGKLYEWFKNPGEWRLCKSAPTSRQDDQIPF